MGRRTGIKKVFSSTTPFTFAIIRTQLFNPEDMPNVEKVQAGYKAQPIVSGPDLLVFRRKAMKGEFNP